MKILYRYILSEFLKLLAITMLAFISVFILVEFVEKIGGIMAAGVPLVEAAGYFLFRLPALVSLIAPVALLLATLLSLGILSRHSEITAVKAGGVSLLNLVVPLLVCGLIISGSVIVLNEAIVPATDRKAEAIEMRWLNKKSTATFGSEGLWIKNEAGIYNIKRLDLGEGLLEGVTLYATNGGFAASDIITAQRAEWRGDAWVAVKARRILLSELGPAGELTVEEFLLPALEGPEGFSAMNTNHEKMSFGELKRYIRELRAQGYDVSKYVVDLYGKLTFPLVNFIMVLIGAPFALRSGRRGGIADSVAISILIAFSYWIVFATSRTLGQSAVIPPVMAAAFPDVIFLAIGIYLFSHVKQ